MRWYKIAIHPRRDGYGEIFNLIKASLPYSVCGEPALPAPGIAAVARNPRGEADAGEDYSVEPGPERRMPIRGAPKFLVWIYNVMI